VDFTIEVERSMRVLDGVVMVLDAVKGVEPQTETVWRQAERYAVPRLIFVNKMDRPGADFLNAVNTVRLRLKGNPVVVAIPILEDSRAGVIDLIGKRWLTFTGERGSGINEGPIPEDLLELADEWYEQLLEAAADADDDIAEAYLSGEAVAAEALKAVLRRETMANAIQVVIGGSALKDFGVQPTLNAVIDFLPSPLEVPEVFGVNPKSGESVAVHLEEKEPLVALVFKVQMIGGRRHVYLKLYRGTLSNGQSVWNANRSAYEKISRIFDMRADRKDGMDSAVAGDIVLAIGLKHASTGDTICASNAPVSLEPIQNYEPVMALAVETIRSSDEEKVVDALNKMVEEDPSLRLVVDPDSGQRLLRGMGELHLSVVLERMQREYGVGIRSGRPRVVYRESIGKTGYGDTLVDRILEKGGRLRARVKVCLRPTSYDKAIEVRIDATAITVSPPEASLSLAQQEWLRETIGQESQIGPIQGYPTVGASVELVAVELFGAESNEVVLREAAARSTRAALQNADAHLLTPIMRIEIDAPSDTIGGVLGDLQARGGVITGMDAIDGTTQVQGECPMEKLFGYANALRSGTQGRGTFTLQFARLDRA